MCTTYPLFPIPTVGSEIYMPTCLYIGHGEDDFIGGRAIVKSVNTGISGGATIHFVTVVERPGRSMNWEQYLAPMQEELRKKFGTEKAHMDPDYVRYDRERFAW